jgi:hypothetical protein
MVAALAYLSFRVVYAPTKLVGRVATWLAEGYRSAPLLERVLIFPSWAVCRGLFIVGWSFSLALHAVARRPVDG